MVLYIYQIENKQQCQRKTSSKVVSLITIFKEEEFFTAIIPDRKYIVIKSRKSNCPSSEVH